MLDSGYNNNLWHYTLFTYTFVVPCVEFLETSKDANLGPLLVMKKMKENLQKCLESHRNKHFILKQIQISLEIIRGVAFLHQLTLPMVQCDLKDKNVMLTFDGVAKFEDFGQTKLKKDVHLQHWGC